ncbi:MAG: DUF1707 domain-containing protein [Micropruina sp.]|uniref:DUF1707 SHOCT-like domain-containing protein n=1 Tax=Micropruina sp. TaxID=2737536 RepID=UPI0039E306D6
MSTPQWQNLPVPESGGGQGWSGFSADPRDPQYQQLRASDADRTNAASMLADAYAEGRLDNDEYNQRLDQAMSSKSLGELVPVLSDLTPARPASASGGPTLQAPQRGGLQGMIGRFPRWWLGLAVMLNLIWLMTVVGTGHLIYYWPMWPMLGTAIPMIMGLINGDRGGSRQDRAHRRDQRAIDRGYQPPDNDLR